MQRVIFLITSEEKPSLNPRIIAAKIKQNRYLATPVSGKKIDDMS